MPEGLPINGQSFPSSARLLTSADFKIVFDNPDFKVSHRFGLLLGKTNLGNRSRLGLVIAKKNVRLAVQRNRVKRLVREHFRQSPLPLATTDIIFLARRGLGDQDNQTVAILLETLWQRLLEQQNGRTP